MSIYGTVAMQSHRASFRDLKTKIAGIVDTQEFLDYDWAPSAETGMRLPKDHTQASIFAMGAVGEALQVMPFPRQPEMLWCCRRACLSCLRSFTKQSATYLSFPDTQMQTCNFHHTGYHQMIKPGYMHAQICMCMFSHAQAGASRAI